MVTLMTLDLYHYDEAQLRQQFEILLAKSPRFFKNTPIVVSLEHLHDAKSHVDLNELRELCAGYGINLIAIRGGSSQHRHLAHKIKLAWLAGQNSNNTAAALSRKKVATLSVNPEVIPSPQQNPSPPKNPEHSQEKPVYNCEAPRVISTPIRSGQQVYHNGDLILTAPVSVGAEVLAAGNIHAYGPFRGRALAGVNGDSSARIYAMNFEAELVSIQGHYKMGINVDKDLWKKAVQIYMDNDTLVLSLL